MSNRVKLWRGRHLAAEALEPRRLLAAINWTGTFDHMSWNQAGNWSPNSVPTGTDDVTINTGDTIQSNATQAVHDLTFRSGTISGSGELDVGGMLHWAGGTMAGSGKTTVAAGGSLTLDTNFHQLNRELDVNAPATWTAGDIGMNGGTFNNNAAFTATPAMGSTLSMYGSGGANAFNILAGGSFVLNGAGTVQTFTSSTAAPFNNAGAVTIQSGTLQLGSGGMSTGPFTVNSTGTLVLAGDYTFGAGSSVSGAGMVQFNGGTQSFASGQFTPTGTVNFHGGSITINNSFTPTALGPVGATVTLNADQSFPSLTLVGGGTIQGSGNVTVTGPFHWMGGTLSGSGKTTVAAAGSLTLDTNFHQLNRELDVNAPATWTAGDIGMNGGTFNNNAAFTATPAMSSTLSMYGSGGTNAFNNQSGGSFVLNGAGTVQTFTSSTAAPFNNAGAVTIQSGTLQLGSGGTGTGPFTVNSTGTLIFTSDYTFNPGSSVSGAGTVQFNGGTQSFASGQFTPTGTVNFHGGSITINNGFTLAALGPVGATVTLNADQSFPSLTLVGGGAIQGSGNVTVTGPFHWAGGTMAGSGKTTVAAAGSLTLDSNFHQLNRELDVNGPSTWTAGDIAMNGGTFNNAAAFTATPAMGSTLSMYGTGGTNAFNIQSGGSFVLNGAGTVQTFTSSAAIPFNNAGTVTIQGGTLQLGSGGTGAGPFTVNSGDTLVLAGDYTFNPGSSVSGAGTVQFNGGTQSFASGQFTPTGTVNFHGGSVTINNTFTPTALGPVGATVTLNADQSFPGLTLVGGGAIQGSGNVTVTGPFHWMGGTLSGSGKTTVAAAGSLTLDSNFHQLNRELDVNGPTTWTAGDIAMNGGTFNNAAAFTATPAMGSTLSMYGTGGTNAFNNQSGGSFVLNGAGTVQTFTSSAAVPFNNAGTVTLQSGTLQLGSGGNHSGDFNTQSGTTLKLGGDQTFAASSHINGNLDLEIDSGTGTYANGLNTTGTVTFQGGSFTIGGNASAAALRCTGGTGILNGAANSTGSLTITGGKLVLGGGPLTIHYGGNPTPASTIRMYLISGALAAASGHGVLGYADGADGIVAGLAAGDLLIKPTVVGDANLDGKVGFADLVLLARHYGQTNATWDVGDFDYDGKVDFNDLVALARHYGQTAPATAQELLPLTTIIRRRSHTRAVFR